MRTHILCIFLLSINQKLDIQYQDQSFHGNYSAVRSLRQVVSYICKHNNYTAIFENLFDGKLLTAKEFIFKEVKDRGVDARGLYTSTWHQSDSNDTSFRRTGTRLSTVSQ